MRATCATSSCGARAPIFSLKMRWRRAASIFYALTAAEATREPDEGPAWRGLVLGLPVERYLRFRQAVQDAEAGKCSLEDGLFALFFLLDAALRKEAWLARGA